MGSGREKKPSQELFSTPSSIKKGAHQTFIKSLLDKGYKIDSEETDHQTGLEGEIISETEITILKPSSEELPMLKFEAKETFGHYDYESGAFDEWDNPNFNVTSYKKPSDIRSMNAPWQMIDLSF